MDAALAKLRPFNVIAGLLHFASFVAILLLANDAALPVKATYLNSPTGSDAFGEPITLFSINIGHAVAGFLLLSALFPFAVASPWAFPRTTAGLRAHHNTFRWAEYSLSSSIMIVLILQLNGIADDAALIGLFTVNASMILFGWAGLV